VQAANLERLVRSSSDDQGHKPPGVSVRLLAQPALMRVERSPKTIVLVSTRRRVA
jgi:hypothetical protein